MAAHITTVTETRRSLGRSVITDHHWSCACGAKNEAKLGFSTRRDAEVNAGSHRSAARRAN